MNKEFNEVVESKGFKVVTIHDWAANKLGKMDQIKIANDEFEIIFNTNVLHGRNYFKMVRVSDLQKNKVYYAERYFKKFIPLVNAINGEAHIKLKR